jgi:lysozyme family protein
MAKVPLSDALRAQYQKLFETCAVQPARQAEADRAAQRLMTNSFRYQAVAAKTGVPWPVIATIHMMECGGRFDQHLHNGDPLTARTVQVPAGRPADGEPPFAWEASAEDALVLAGMAAWQDWSVPGTLYKLEGYNGWGYRLRHPDVLTPYLWAGCQHYAAGKFVADGTWSATAVSKQIGAAVLLRRLMAAGEALAATPDPAVRLIVATAAQGPQPQPVVPGWSARTYPIAATRGDGGPPTPLDLPANAVLELTLADGTRLLVAAGDAHGYLGAPERGVDNTDFIRVGQSLRPDPTLRLGTSRDGLGSWIVSSLRVFRHGPAAMTALVAAGAYQDSQLEDRLGIYRCRTDAWGLTPAATLPTGQAVLLFIHGTGSSAAGSFAGLWQDAFRKRIAADYGDRVYAFEHRSLTESPIANALALAKALPAGARLHLLTHSRGGMVGELLARANRCQGESFDEGEIAAFLDYAERTGREGFADDAERLRELNRELTARRIRVERFVRVAGPIRGTTLASGKLDRWATVMLNLVGNGVGLAASALPGGTAIAKGADLLTSFLLSVVKERTDARVLPGLEAMMSDSPLVSLLNGPAIEVEGSLHVVAGDYQGAGLLARLGDWLSESFYGSETDLVVNTPSMAGGARRSAGIWQLPMRGPDVNHFTYFTREESAGAICDALAGCSQRFQALAGPAQASVSRGGRKPLLSQDAPIALLLPGVMGSHLQVGNKRVWFEAMSLWKDGIGRLSIDAAGVTPDGWLDHYYQDLALHLAETHEVRPFAYDWRISLAEEAQRFSLVLDQALTDARRRGRPVHIVAHCMGGLVARLALQDRWGAFKSLPGSRLLQLGTPNNGAHATAGVLLGRDDFVQMIEHWFDFRFDVRQFLDYVKDFPGVLELLPWPTDNGLAGDGVDYFSVDTWQGWHRIDNSADGGAGWPLPTAGALSKAKAVVTSLAAAPVDPDCTLYVAGCADATPIAVRLDNGGMEIRCTPDGDGRVPWKTGIPVGVCAWYAPAAHGDLPAHRDAFAAYTELLLSGRTDRLPETPASARGGLPVASRRAAPLVVLRPTEDELMAAALGGRRPGWTAAVRSQKAVIEVVHGSLVAAEAPVVIGAYAGDALRGSADFLNRRLGGVLAGAQQLNRYPGQVGEAAVFLPPNSRPAGAVVVGLGAVGSLTQGELTRAYSHGLLEFARQAESRGARRLAAASLLVGTGYGGVSIGSSVRALVEALRCANRKLEESRSLIFIERLTLYEVAEDRAIAAAQALEKLVREHRYQDSASFSGRLKDGHGGFRRLFPSQEGNDGWYRVHIVTESATGDLRFTLVGNRAQNEVSEEPNQRQAVDGLIAAATGSTTDNAGLSRALFELMVPNALKDLVPDVSGLVLAVDMAAAVYPWELMRDETESGEPPLAARVGLVRQLALPRGWGRVPTVRNRRVFVVGDTDSGLMALPAAQAEGATVAAAFSACGYEVNFRARPGAGEVLVNLFDSQYFAIHLAGHGAVDLEQNGARYTGMVLGPGTFLTAAQARKLRHAPEFVFINCCHLGAMAADADDKRQWAQLAANLATEFIEIGCKAVVAAGWAVDDQAADTFAQSFYQSMLAGEHFGDALRLAREETYARYPTSNTWGAYQAYGDEGYRFPAIGRRQRTVPNYRHADQLLADLDRLQAELPGLGDGADREGLLVRLNGIEASVRGRFFDRAEVREKLGAIHADLGRTEAAIEHYRAALAQEDGQVSIHALEQLADLEIGHGAKLAKDIAVSGQYLGQGRQRLDVLIQMAPTAERLSLLGGYWRRRAQILRTAGMGKAKGKQMPASFRDALVGMTKAYMEAWQESVRRTGEPDYYPLHNALDGAWLLKAWGENQPFDDLRPRLPEFLAAANRNAERRQAENPRACHALAETQGALIAALWAAQAAGSKDAITVPAVRDRVAGRFLDVVGNQGFEREKDLVIEQLVALRNLLPDGQLRIREAMGKVADNLR